MLRPGLQRRARPTAGVLLVLAALLPPAAASAGGPPADRPTIAYANLAADPGVGRAAIDALRAEVARRAAAAEPASPPVRAALEDPLGEAAADAATRARALELLGAARAAAAGDPDAALDGVARADLALRQLAPSPATIALLAEANRLAGAVLAGRGEEARALDAFALARRLSDAPLEPDAGAAAAALFARAAGAAASGGAAVEVSCEPPGATVWLDGRAAGVAPVRLDAVPPGVHYVGATLAGHQPRAERILLADGDRRTLAVLLPRLPRDERIRALRRALAADPSPEGAAPLAARLADAVGVDVLVVVRAEDGAPVTGALYDRRTGALAAPVGLADPAALAAAIPSSRSRLAVLAPGDVPLPAEPGPAERPRRRWTSTRWGMAVLVGGGVVLTGALLLLAAD